MRSRYTLSQPPTARPSPLHPASTRCPPPVRSFCRKRGSLLTESRDLFIRVPTLCPTILFLSVPCLSAPRLVECTAPLGADHRGLHPLQRHKSFFIRNPLEPERHQLDSKIERTPTATVSASHAPVLRLFQHPAFLRKIPAPRSLACALSRALFARPLSSISLSLFPRVGCTMGGRALATPTAPRGAAHGCTAPFRAVHRSTLASFHTSLVDMAWMQGSFFFGNGNGGRVGVTVAEEDCVTALWLPSRAHASPTITVVTGNRP